jgi:beta-lactamase class A
VFYFKKGFGKLSSLQFAILIAVTALLTTFVGATLIRQKSQVDLQQSIVQSNPESKSEKIVPNISSLPEVPKSSILAETYAIPQIKRDSKIENIEIAYNDTKLPKFEKSTRLQEIVSDIIALTQKQKLPKQSLSITLIDVKNNEYAEYQQEIPRFPASVVKTFWMVNFFAQAEKGLLDEATFTPYLNEMIKRSDNNSASYILDSLTQTESGKELQGKDYDDWLNKRQKVNKFFKSAGYTDINVNQKTFPITYQKIYEPKGSDLKMRGNPNHPIRNKVSTQKAAKLFYEIYSKQAVSAQASQKMMDLLTIDPATRIEKKHLKNPDEFNPVRGYFSEVIPNDIYIGAKAGWTSSTRQEAAYIATPDGKTAYILVVFAEDRAYAQNEKIFPQISKLVLNRMSK